MRIDLAFSVNGEDKQLSVATNTTVAELLRDALNLTGCRVACDAEVCGCCTVLIDGLPKAACATFAFEIEGSRIETIEAWPDCDVLQTIQQAFLEADAFQCGFCTPGFVLSVKALLTVDAAPSDETIRQWLQSNICRCTGYQPIIAATRSAASRIAALRLAATPGEPA